MRRRLMMQGMFASSFGVLEAAPALAQSQSRLTAALSSVLKVDAGNHTASGFLWPDPQHMVTALHVVDNTPNFVGHLVNKSGQIEQSLKLTVERVLRNADLVLLRLESPVQRPVLKLSTKSMQVKQSMDAIGFPLNIAGASSTEVKLRAGGDTLSAILPPKVLGTITDYPSRSLEILNLEGNLVPGLSGGAIVDEAGDVVGIADGGIEEGAVGICWGIPAKNLARLAQSSDTKLPRIAASKALFRADLDASVETLPTLGNVSLTRLRSRTFEQLASTADDGLGLTQLVSQFAYFNPPSFVYDVYQDLSSGATVVVPKGSQLRYERGFIVAAGPGFPRMSLRIQIRDISNQNDAQYKSAEFERDMASPLGPDQGMLLDQAWSYLGPVQRNDFTIRRKAFTRVRASPTGPIPERYYFETLAFNRKVFLGVVAINTDQSYESSMRKMQCAQGYAQGPDCNKLISDRRAWAQLVLGVQFSSFPIT